MAARAISNTLTSVDAPYRRLRKVDAIGGVRWSEARREAFQISPQALHRQYAFSSGFRAVVVIEGD